MVFEFVALLKFFFFFFFFLVMKLVTSTNTSDNNEILHLVVETFITVTIVYNKLTS